MWILFLLLHLIGLVSYSLILRKSLVLKGDKWTLATVMQTGIAIPMLVALFIAPPDLSVYNAGVILQIIVAALFVLALHFTNVQALQTLEAGTYSILYNLRIIFTTILGVVFLGEDVVWLQILGGIFIFLAVLTVKQKGKKEKTTKGIWWGLAAGLSVSLLNVFDKKLISDVGFLEYSIPAMLLAAVVMWIILLLQGKRIKPSYFAEPKTISLMFFRAMSAYCFLIAFYLGAILSVSTYISSLSVVIIVLLGAWLLKERDYLKQKLAATALAVVGLTLILISNLN
jgi:drug/metabolite transporter (DMT)-like permease